MASSDFGHHFSGIYNDIQNSRNFTKAHGTENANMSKSNASVIVT